MRWWGAQVHVVHVQPVPAQNASVSKFQIENTQGGQARVCVENFELGVEKFQRPAHLAISIRLSSLFELEPPPPRAEPLFHQAPRLDSRPSKL